MGSTSSMGHFTYLFIYLFIIIIIIKIIEVRGTTSTTGTNSP
jgi:hypothetical protein